MTQKEQIILGAGCFWCVEAIFQRLIGVIHVENGYSGGDLENPTYKDICTGTTNHAEVIKIEYNPQEISLQDLLYVFWRTHDPTTLNRQGGDVGTQYRSVIFYNSEEQQQVSIQSKQETDASSLWSQPIVTEISPLVNYYSAEDYHQNYFNDNPTQPYCNFVIGPKIAKLEKDFQKKLKPKYSSENL